MTNYKKQTGNFVRNEVSSLESREYARPIRNRSALIDLSLNINPCGVSAKVIEELKCLSPKKVNHYYTENDGLLQEIAGYVHVNPSNILLGDGCDGCLHLIAMTFLNRGDEVIIPVPTFHRYEFHSALMGALPRFVPMKEFLINSEDVLQAVTLRTKIIFLCNPNNPTGMQIDQKIQERILEGFKGVVVIDEALADASGINGSSLLKKYNNVIIVRSFSKTFGLASLRIGYLVASQEIIEWIKKTSSPFQVNGIAQELALIALRDKEYIAASKEYIKKNREFLINQLENLGLPCTSSITTNFLVEISKLGMQSSKVTELLLKKGALVTDGKAFRLPRDNYIRVAVASEEENKKFIEIVRSLLHFDHAVKFKYCSL